MLDPMAFEVGINHGSGGSESDGTNGFGGRNLMRLIELMHRAVGNAYGKWEMGNGKYPFLFLSLFFLPFFSLFFLFPKARG